MFKTIKNNLKQSKLIDWVPDADFQITFLYSRNSNEFQVLFKIYISKFCFICQVLFVI